MKYVKTVTPLKGCRLYMEMDSGSSVVIDLSGKLRTMKYAELADEALFFDVETDGDYVTWGRGRVKVTVKELMDIVLLGNM